MVRSFRVVFAPLTRGDHVAVVERSFLNHAGDRVILSLVLAYRGNGRKCKAILDFAIHHPNPALERRERARLQDLAEAMGIDLLEDSKQLHGIPFRLTIWNADNPLRFSARPLAERGVGVGEMVGGKGMHPLPHHIIFDADGDGPGPHAA